MKEESPSPEPSRNDYTLPPAVDGQSSMMPWIQKYGVIPMAMLRTYSAQRACSHIPEITQDNWTAARDYFVDPSGSGSVDAAHQVLSVLQEMKVQVEQCENDHTRSFVHLLDSQHVPVLSIERIQVGLTTQFRPSEFGTRTSPSEGQTDAALIRSPQLTGHRQASTQRANPWPNLAMQATSSEPSTGRNDGILRLTQTSAAPAGPRLPMNIKQEEQEEHEVTTAPPRIIPAPIWLFLRSYDSDPFGAIFNEHWTHCRKILEQGSRDAVAVSCSPVLESVVSEMYWRDWESLPENQEGCGTIIMRDNMEDPITGKGRAIGINLKSDRDGKLHLIRGKLFDDSPVKVEEPSPSHGFEEPPAIPPQTTTLSSAVVNSFRRAPTHRPDHIL